MTPTPSEIVAMLKKRPRACEAIDALVAHGLNSTWIGDWPISGTADAGSPSHLMSLDLATGRCARLCWADGMEPFQNAVGGWCVYDRDTGQPVTHPFESPLEAMLEYLQTREEPK